MKSKDIFVFIGLIVLISLLISGYSKNKSEKPLERDRLFNNGWKFIRDSVAGAAPPAVLAAELAAATILPMFHTGRNLLPAMFFLQGVFQGSLRENPHHTM
jgi:hypothetical protein